MFAGQVTAAEVKNHIRYVALRGRLAGNVRGPSVLRVVPRSPAERHWPREVLRVDSPAYVCSHVPPDHLERVWEGIGAHPESCVFAGVRM